MNTISLFLVEVALTLLICISTVLYLRPFLRRILVDLCGAEDRAQFWTVFSCILLVGMPLLIALTYHPEAQSAEELFFEITHRISGNLSGFLFAMLGMGFIISFFALVAPCVKESK
jgi:tellurite resistance protein TehA-like permease